MINGTQACFLIKKKVHSNLFKINIITESFYKILKHQRTDTVLKNEDTKNLLPNICEKFYNNKINVSNKTIDFIIP